MKLSMWILSDWLEKYNPDNRITEGDQTLRGVRLFSSDVRFENQNVYLGVAKDFISSDSENIICINGHDMILLKTKDLEAVMNDIFDAFDFYNRWADGLVSDIYEGCTLQELVDKSHEVFDDPITLHDSGNVLTANSSEYGLGSLDEEWDTILTTKNMSLDTLHRMKDHLQEMRSRKDIAVVELDDFSPSFMVRNLFANQKNMGRAVLLVSKHSVTKGRLHLFESFSNIVETWLKFNSERNEMLGENALFLDLLSEKQVVENEIFKKLMVFGWEETQKKIVITINNSSFSSEFYKPLLTSLEKSLVNCYVIEYKNEIIVIINQDITPLNRTIEVIMPLLKRTSSYCAISYDFIDILKLRTAYEQTELTLTHCPKKEGQIYYCKDYALTYIYSVIKAHVNQNIVHPALLKLENNDIETNGELYNTLFEFLKNERNLVKSAASLNIHRNTLVYRLNKIQLLTEVDLDDPDVRAYLMWSYKIS